MDLRGRGLGSAQSPRVDGFAPSQNRTARTSVVRKGQPTEASNEKRALSLVGASLAQLGPASPSTVIQAAVSALDAPAVQGLVAKADDARPKSQALGRAPWSKTLSRLSLGGPHDIPAMAIRPGQTQLSFDHAREKALGIAEAILDERPKKLADLFAPDDFPVVVGPEGSFALLRDGHHKLAGLLALSSLVHGILGTGTAASSRTALNVGEAWKALAEVVPPPDQLEIPAWVAGQEAKIAPDQKVSRRVDDFFSLFDDPERYSPGLYLRTKDGGSARVTPERMSELDDNPFRRLAAELVAKFKWDEDGMPKLRNAERPLWLKGPDAPDYVEFHVAEVMERTSEQVGFEYRPGVEVPDEVRDAFRGALLEAQREGHPILNKVISFEHETSWDKLRASLDLIPHAVLDFGEKESALKPDEIPIVLLAGDAPDVHRLHAAARLHDALVDAGANLSEKALTKDIALATIARLDPVDDTVGLWVNRSGLTKAELTRNAELAQGLGAAVERQKKTKLVLAEDTPSKRPLWVDVPGLPQSVPYVLGDLWGDLLAGIEHDAQRLPEIAQEARKRLIEAKTQTDHPFYERVAAIPVVVAGRAEDVAASLRVGRKKGILQVGHPVEDVKERPHILPPRTQLHVDR